MLEKLSVKVHIRQCTDAGLITEKERDDMIKLLNINSNGFISLVYNLIKFDMDDDVVALYKDPITVHTYSRS